VRTSSLIKWNFKEGRRRGKVIPGFMTEKSRLKLVFATLIRAFRRCHYESTTGKGKILWAFVFTGKKDLT
jgi:hypothetical protein